MVGEMNDNYYYHVRFLDLNNSVSSVLFLVSSV